MNSERENKITVADRETRPFEQGKPVPHSETSHLVFLCTQHICPGANCKTLWVWWGKPIMKVKMDIYFFGAQTPRGSKTSAKAKTPPSVGARPVCALGTYWMATSHAENYVSKWSKAARQVPSSAGYRFVQNFPWSEAADQKVHKSATALVHCWNANLLCQPLQLQKRKTRQSWSQGSPCFRTRCHSLCP